MDSSFTIISSSKKFQFLLEDYLTAYFDFLWNPEKQNLELVLPIIGSNYFLEQKTMIVFEQVDYGFHFSEDDFQEKFKTLFTSAIEYCQKNFEKIVDNELATLPNLSESIVTSFFKINSPLLHPQYQTDCHFESQMENAVLILKEEIKIFNPQKVILIGKFDFMESVFNNLFFEQHPTMPFKTSVFNGSTLYWATSKSTKINLDEIYFGLR